MPKTFEDFQRMKYNDVGRWNQYKHDYRIVNQYINHTNISMESKKILELDKIAFETKRNLFSSDYKKSGNFGIMELDGEIYYSHSKANYKDDKAYKKFNGDKSRLILKPNIKNYKTKLIGSHDRDVDSEYKLFEYATTLVNDGDEHELNMLSEISSCESCLGVMEQFMDKFPNVKISMVSTKESRMKKKYIEENKELEVFRNRWKK